MLTTRLLVLTMALSLASSVSTVAGAQTSARPNIVFILTDDLDFAVMDSLFSVGLAPNIRALRDGGTEFTQTFASVPLCCPDRTSFLRGQYKHNHGVVANFPPIGGWDKFLASGYEDASRPDPQNVGVAMQRAGYTTAYVGKYLNYYEGELIGGARDQPDAVYRVPGGWSLWRGQLVGSAAVGPRDYRFYDFFSIENALNAPVGVGRYYPKAEANYATDVFSRQAREVVDAARSEDKPLFLVIAPKAPHDTVETNDAAFDVQQGYPTPALRHRDAPVDPRAPRKPSFNEDDVADKPRNVRDLRGLTQADADAIDKRHRRRQRSMLAVDDLIGDLRRHLAASGQDANTYYVFTSDNGWFNGEHRIGAGKQYQYEEGIKIPHYVLGPGVPAGAKRDELLGMHDFFPTFATLGGGTVPDYVDGRSFVALLQGQRIPWRKRILVEASGLRGNGSEPAYEQFAVLRRYPSIVYVQTLDLHNTLAFEEVYDLGQDPHQLNNLQPRQPAQLVQEHRAATARLRRCGVATIGGPSTCWAVETEAIRRKP